MLLVPREGQVWDEHFTDERRRFRLENFHVKEDRQGKPVPRVKLWYLEKWTPQTGWVEEARWGNRSFYLDQIREPRWTRYFPPMAVVECPECGNEFDLYESDHYLCEKCAVHGPSG